MAYSQRIETDRDINQYIDIYGDRGCEYYKECVTCPFAYEDGTCKKHPGSGHKLTASKKR